MQFWIGLVIGCMVGTLVGVAFLSMVIAGKEADERMVKPEKKGFEGKA